MDKNQLILGLKINQKVMSENILFSDFELTVNDGEIVSITGASGCGKSTVLRMIAGLEPLNNDGTMNINLDVSEIGFIFQKPILYPHLSVGKTFCWVAKPSCQSRSRLVWR